MCRHFFSKGVERPKRNVKGLATKEEEKEEKEEKGKLKKRQETLDTLHTPLSWEFKTAYHPT